jgi:hypothetical protein
MQRKWLMLAASAVMGTAMLTGCMEKQGDLGNRNIKSNSIRYDMNGNRILNKRFANDQMNEMNRVEGRRLNSNNIVGYHANYRLEMSQDIADKLAAMKEIDKAYVMLTDNNAYVAVTLADSTSHKGIRNMSLTPGAAVSRTRLAYLRPGISGGLRPLASSTATGTGTTSTGSTGITGTTGTTSTGSVGTTGATGAGSTGITGTGLGTTAASADVAQMLKHRIAMEVHKMAPQINNVYVSANPDFVGRMTSYMEDVRLGHPIQGFVAEFNAMVERIFPAHSGIATAKR